MKEKLRKAILNNNDLYEAVFDPQNINFSRNEFVWYCLEKTPPLYSNLVTVSEDWKPDEIFKAIDENFKNKNWKDWSIKDSFAVLDLNDYGFKKLFDAEWIYLEATKFTPANTGEKFEFKVVKTENDLSDWRIAWDLNEDLGKQIFQPQMLNNPKIYFVAGYKNEKIKCGCLLNETEDILGISNFFAPDDNLEHWSETIKFIFNSIKFADIVGYERDFLRNQLEDLGFENIGNLSVWIRKTDIF